MASMTIHWPPADRYGMDIADLTPDATRRGLSISFRGRDVTLTGDRAVLEDIKAKLRPEFPTSVIEPS